jgi:hypothetical protein
MARASAGQTTVAARMCQLHFDSEKSVFLAPCEVPYRLHGWLKHHRDPSLLGGHSEAQTTQVQTWPKRPG